MNNIVDYVLLNTEIILNIDITIGVVLYSCLSFEYASNVFGLYIRGKATCFIYEAFALTVVTSYSCDRHKLIELARVCSRASVIEFLGFRLDNVKDVMRLSYGFQGTLLDVITTFSKANGCVIDIQCLIMQ